VIEHGLPGNTAHLLAQSARLEGDAVVGVVDDVELPGWRRRRCFIGDRHMLGQIGFAPQAAVGRVLALVRFHGLDRRRPLQREG